MGSGKKEEEEQNKKINLSTVNQRSKIITVIHTELERNCKEQGTTL